MNSVNSSDEDMSPTGRSQVRGQKMQTVFLAVSMSVYIAKVVPLLITLYSYQCQAEAIEDNRSTLF